MPIVLHQTPFGAVSRVTESGVVDTSAKSCTVQVAEGTSVRVLAGAFAGEALVPMRDANGAAIVLAAPGVYALPVRARFIGLVVTGDGDALLSETA